MSINDKEPRATAQNRFKLAETNEETTIDKLVVGEKAYGKKMICKLIDDPTGLHTPSVYTRLNDRNGTTMACNVFNVENQEEIFAQVFRKGRRFMLLDPYLKIFPGGVHGIRVDSPREIVFEEEMELVMQLKEKTPDLQKLKEDANNLFRNGNIDVALMFYQKIWEHIQNSDDTEMKDKIAGNIGLCLKKKRKFRESSNFLREYVQKTQKPTSKLQYLISEAEIGLENFTEALKILQDLTADKAEENSIKKRIEDVKNYIHEKETGEYDFLKMFKELEASETGEVYFDVADHLNKKVKFCEIPNKGFGAMAAENIEKGDLIICSKAFEVFYSKQADHDYGQRISLEYAKQIENFDLDYFVKYFRNERHKEILFQRVADNEDYKTLLFALDYTHGNELIPLKDSKSANQIEEAGIPDHITTFFQEHNFDVEAIKQRIIFNRKNQEFNKKMASDVILYNCFDTSHESEGFWLVPSFFNHSCLPNCHYFCYGNLIFIKTMRKISIGEELTVRYVSGTIDFQERKQKLSGWGFECHCELCEKKTTAENPLDYFIKYLQMCAKGNPLLPPKDAIPYLVAGLDFVEKRTAPQEEFLFYAAVHYNLMKDLKRDKKRFHSWIKSLFGDDSDELCNLVSSYYLSHCTMKKQEETK